jgi:hypothetical protein
MSLYEPSLYVHYVMNEKARQITSSLLFKANLYDLSLYDAV